MHITINTSLCNLLPPPPLPLKEEVEEKSKIKTTVGNETLWAQH